MAPIPRLRDYRGPALLSYGFRPFFLFGSLYAGLAILAWLPFFHGELEVSTTFAPRDWHVHEMLYGFLPAVITGFLLTSVPNWTGRMPLQGWPLLALVLAWTAGRVAVTTSARIGWEAAAVIDNAFLVLVAAAICREISKGRNWRNLKVLIPLTLLVTGNIVFHLESGLSGTADYGIRLGIAATMMLIMLIGGRIIPSFTRNWLARENPGRLPAPFGKFDVVSMVGAGLALTMWVALPENVVTAVSLVAAGGLQAARMARWAGDRTWRDRLVLILHVGYAFVPLGFVLVGLAAVGLLPSGAGIHAWTGGAMGIMTLAVMSRASLGHAGRTLVATAPAQALYLLLAIAATSRVCASVHQGVAPTSCTWRASHGEPGSSASQRSSGGFSRGRGRYPEIRTTRSVRPLHQHSCTAALCGFCLIQINDGRSRPSCTRDWHLAEAGWSSAHGT